MAAGGSGSPCGACKFLRRKYFCSEQGPARFAAIHKVFGASNVSKLLSHVPEPDRCEAVMTMAYEAQARMHDPVHGCVAQMFALQQQVACLQAQLVQAKAQLARGIIGCRSSNNPLIPVTFPTCAHSGCAPSSIDDAVGYNKCATGMHEIDVRDGEFCFQPSSSAKKRPIHGDLGELQALAHRMMVD